MITHDVRYKYLNGDCDALAYALHKKCEKPISILTGFYMYQNVSYPYLAHAFIRWSEGIGLDIRGLRSVLDIRKEFRHKKDRVEYTEFATLDEMLKLTNRIYKIEYNLAKPFADHLLLEISKNPV